MSVEKHHPETSQRNLLIATLLNFLISAVEIAGGILSNSLALLSDAVHNLSDAVAVLIAYLAGKIGNRQPDPRRTFGFRRAEILAALLNAVILIVVTVYLFYEAYRRFQEPAEIKGRIMFIIALVGLAANLAAVFLLRTDAHRNINIRAAYVHLVGDSLSSVAVILGSLLIHFFGWYWIDPLVTMLIGLYILKHAWLILREAVDILMQAGPRNIDILEVCETLEGIPGIANIHHVHLWNLTDQQVHFECHADLKGNLTIEQTGPVLKDMERILLDEYRISHITVQFEYNRCEDQTVIHGENQNQRSKIKDQRSKT
jgi:cobalt-zinc-cadmium efflux system protein